MIHKGYFTKNLLNQVEQWLLSTIKVSRINCYSELEESGGNCTNLISQAPRMKMRLHMSPLTVHRFWLENQSMCWLIHWRNLGSVDFLLFQKLKSDLKRTCFECECHEMSFVVPSRGFTRYAIHIYKKEAWMLKILCVGCNLFKAWPTQKCGR